MSDHLSYEDICQLTQLNFRYARALDLDQPELLHEVFTDDMVLEFHPSEHGPGLRFEGLGSFLSRSPVPFRAQHFLSNHEFRTDADRITGISYVQGQHWLAASPSDLYLIGARYEDTYRREGGGWRIAERHCYYMWTQGNPDVLTGHRSNVAPLHGTRPSLTNLPVKFIENKVNRIPHKETASCAWSPTRSRG